MNVFIPRTDISETARKWVVAVQASGENKWDDWPGKKDLDWHNGAGFAACSLKTADQVETLKTIHSTPR